jgi:hypothetical protein
MATRHYLKGNPLRCFQMLWWLAHGRAHLKHQLGERVTLDPAGLSYRPSVLSYLQHVHGRVPLYLVTATDQVFAQAVADHMGLFQETFASDGRTNLRAHAKGHFLAERFEVNGYIYIGNSYDDLAVWQTSAEVWYCEDGPAFEQAVTALHKPLRAFK